MKKILQMTAVAGLAAVLAAGCTNVETNRVGEQVSIHMPVYVQPDVEVKKRAGQRVRHGPLRPRSFLLGAGQLGGRTQLRDQQFSVGQ